MVMRTSSAPPSPIPVNHPKYVNAAPTSLALKNTHPAMVITKVNITNAVRQFKRKGALLAIEGSRSRDGLLTLDEEVRETYLGPMQKLFVAGRLLPPRPEA